MGSLLSFPRREPPALLSPGPRESPPITAGTCAVRFPSTASPPPPGRPGPRARLRPPQCWWGRGSRPLWLRQDPRASSLAGAGEVRKGLFSPSVRFSPAFLGPHPPLVSWGEISRTDRAQIPHSAAKAVPRVPVGRKTHRGLSLPRQEPVCPTTRSHSFINRHSAGKAGRGNSHARARPR